MTSMQPIRFGTILAFALAGVQAAVAAPGGSPDAGSLQQQIERERQPQLPGRVAPERPVLPPAMQPASGVTVTVKQFRFAGNTLLTDEQLAPAVAAYLDRPLTFSELQAAAAAVAEVYRNAGWVVRVYLPQQDIEGGQVTLQIVEAVFGRIQLEGAPTERFDAARAVARFEAIQSHGQPINTDRLDRALLLFDDLPGVTATASLRAGAAAGETDLALKLADEPWLSGEIGADNTAPRATGNERITANLSLNSPLKRGDQLTANLIHSRGNDYLRLGYTLPVGDDGWRVGANASWLEYDLVARPFNQLEAQGNFASVGLTASYPLIRTRLKNLFLGLIYDHKRFDNEANQITTTRYRIDTGSVSLSGNLFDQLGGGGANAAGLTLTHGHLDLGRLDLSEDPRLDGRFTKLNYYLSRQQVITDTLSLYAALSGQTASTRLDSAERFYLGGANGVRAYPANEASGPDGQLLTLELRLRLPQNLGLAGFYDLGHVSDTGMANHDDITLKGYGLSAAWTAPFGLALKATWARRIGDNPLQDPATGRDTDGSHREHRFWLQAMMPF